MESGGEGSGRFCRPVRAARRQIICTPLREGDTETDNCSTIRIGAERCRDLMRLTCFCSTNGQTQDCLKTVWSNYARNTNKLLTPCWRNANRFIANWTVRKMASAHTADSGYGKRHGQNGETNSRVSILRRFDSTT